jgi:hypothetical protein
MVPSAQDTPLETLLARVVGEYRESPGLSLTRAQFQRLWSLDGETCDSLVDTLIASHVLRRTRTGSFIRDEDQR